MKIYRIETLEIDPDPGQTIEDIQAMVEKAQYLTYYKCDFIDDDEDFMLVVRRKVELFPDTIK